MAEQQRASKTEALTIEAPAAYGRGTILRSEVEEGKKMLHGRRLIRERVMAQGKGSVYNLTGLVRAFPLDTEDLPALDSQLSFAAYFAGRAEELAIRHMGGDPKQHGAVICNRVTSAMLAIMLAILKRGDRVLSLVPRGRSHPSVQQAVELVGGSFFEVQGIEAAEQALAEGPWSLLVITPMTPQKYHMPVDQVSRAVSRAKERGVLVFSDDAHMASRATFFEEPVAFALEGIDIAVWSLDKHVPGPRSAAIVARQELMDKIQAQAFRFGLEAQTGHYVAALRGMEAYDPEPIRRAGQLARQLFARLRARYGPAVYQAGPGVAISSEDFFSLVLARAQSPQTPLIPGEVTVAACFDMFQRYGVVTIPLTGMPGAAPNLRLMMHPDGARLGLERIETAVEEALANVAGLLQRPDEVRRLILGE